jgi:endoglucanase Acf2
VTRVRRAAAVRLAGSILVVVTAAALGACTPASGTRESPALPSSEVAPLVAGVPSTSTWTLPTTRLAEGLVPPTNRWFSGLVFGDQPQPVFPLPLSFALVDGGVQFGAPTVTSSPGSISAPSAPQLTVTTGADRHTVSRYDEVSVTVQETAGDRVVGSVTVARGSPVVAFTAADVATLHVSAELEPRGAGVWVAQADGRRFALVAPESAVSGTEIDLAAGESASWVAIPDGADVDAIAALAASPVQSVDTSFATAAGSATTTLDYRTADGRDTVVGALPHQAAGLEQPQDCSLGSFTTVYGELRLCRGSRLSWSVPVVEPATSIDLAGLADGQRAELRDQLGEDIASTGELPGDTYFGGKALARLATLLSIARQLDESAAVATLEARLDAALREWTQPGGCLERSERCFAYDAEVRGVVGQAASFGSDEFNDHHFHYGYFLYAAGVAAADDPRLAADLAPVMTLLAADIASGQATSEFPVRRVFDPYSGHSWASGYSPFRDGNNQESSSEAVNAWNGLAVWARAAGDEALEDEATWMLSSEASSAVAYWLAPDFSSPPFDDYDRDVVGIVWDGKRDYGTWFSAEPSAILGIQLLPMGPTADYLAIDADRIREQVATAREGFSAAGQFADYLLMYSALAGRADAAAALEAARTLAGSEIDDGNSRTYMLAWIMAHELRAH